MIDFTRYHIEHPEVLRDAVNVPMHEILAPTLTTQGLYLGSFEAIFHPEELRKHGIHCILAVLDIEDGTHPMLKPQENEIDAKEGEFEIYHVDIDDAEAVADTLKGRLAELCDYVDAALKSGKGVLVHCHWVRPGCGLDWHF